MTGAAWSRVTTVAGAKHTRRRPMLLRGPSPGVQAWTAWGMALGDWLIDARKRWHEGDPPPKPGKMRAVRVGLVLTVLYIAQHFAGGAF
jgi:hypothetical protein